MFASGRAYEQIRNSIGYPKLNVKIGATHGGISVGEDGASHQCCEDFALMRSIPGMTVICPADDIEAKAAVKAAYEMNGPVYLRFGRLAVPVFHGDDYKFEIGKGEVVVDGRNVIHHGSRYTSLDNKELNVETKDIVGSWQRNSLPESPAPVCGKLFLISFEHPAESVCCGNKSSYAYMISSASSEIPAVEIIRNDESVQAIRLGDGTIMDVFYENTILDIDNKTVSGNAVEAKIE